MSVGEVSKADEAKTGTSEPKLPVGEAQVVHDDPVANEEQERQNLVDAVSKKLEVESEPETPKQPDAKSDEPPKGEEPAKAEEEKAEPKMSKALQSRAKGAGLSEELAATLHESGQLEQTLAAFDRSLIEHVKSGKKKPEEGSPTDDGKRGKEPPPESEESGEAPALDPELYDEAIVKRDAYQQKRIADLEAKLDQLIEGQQGGFDEWFDSQLTELGIDTSDEEKCQEVFKAYDAICDAFGKNASGRNKAMVERAYAAMYPNEVFKQQQRQTVDRLRDAEGKFMTSPKTKGGPPAKDATPEEREGKLVSDVTAYLKEQGVEMSGV